ncbi:MAG: hypothetical protein AB7I19_05650 [Planctomycetota bacterium]
MRRICVDAILRGDFELLREEPLAYAAAMADLSNRYPRHDYLLTVCPAPMWGMRAIVIRRADYPNWALAAERGAQLRERIREVVRRVAHDDLARSRK